MHGRVNNKVKNLSALDNRCSPCLGQTRGTQFHGSNSNCHLPVSKPSPLPLRQNLHLQAEIKPSGLSKSEFTVAPKMKSPDYTELYIIPNFSRKALFYKVSCKNIRYNVFDVLVCLGWKNLFISKEFGII